MNVNLWFAKDVDSNEIISVINADNEKEYKCPICDSDVIPKAIESKKVSPHFAHVDKNKCGGEALIHWWMKHRFLEVGEKFTIKTDNNVNYICKSFNTEVRYKLNSGLYIPDIVVETECGNEIVFEMANTNKKQVKDYIDKWIELDKIVVEVDIKDLVNDSKEFKALYYKGKCFNFNKRDGGYYNTIGKLKENTIGRNKYDIESIRKLDWFWDEVINYKKGTINISELSIMIDELYREYDGNQMYSILKTRHCSNLYEDYQNYCKEVWANQFPLLQEKLTEAHGNKFTIEIGRENYHNVSVRDREGYKFAEVTRILFNLDTFEKDEQYILNSIQNYTSRREGNNIDRK